VTPIDPPRSINKRDSTAWVNSSLPKLLPDRRPEVDAYLKTLDDGQRQIIEAAAFRSAKPLVAAGYKRAAANGEGHLQEIYRRAILNQYLVEHLVDPGAGPEESTS
jgi:hypothetical protein